MLLALFALLPALAHADYRCADLHKPVAQTVTFQGELDPKVAGLAGNFGAIPNGKIPKDFRKEFIRVNATGDKVEVYRKGLSAIIVAHLAKSTVDSIRLGTLNGDEASICGLSLNESILSEPTCGAGFAGNMGGGTISLWGKGHWISFQPTGQLILL